MLFSYFPPSFVLIFAREPSDATSIAQAPFRFFTSVTTKCIAVRHPCFDFTTEGGKRIFNTNESKHPITTRYTGTRRLLCEPQTTAIHRAATLRTAHKECHYGLPITAPYTLRPNTPLINLKRNWTFLRHATHNLPSNLRLSLCRFQI